MAARRFSCCLGADPAIPLIKRISEEAHFTFTEREPKDKNQIELVYAGVAGTWDEAVQQE